MKLLKNLFKKKPKTIIIVSGLPRSGTSMMIKMLEAGGLEVLTDHIRKANEDNPKGYYEFERVKKLPEGDTEWLEEARAKVVKIISALIIHLPPTYSYKILFMRRNIAEIIASQNKMLTNRAQTSSKVDDAEVARLFDKHLDQVYAWLNQHPNAEYIDVNYNQMFQDPLSLLKQVNQFLGSTLDVEKMVAVLDPSLYRQRR